MSSLTKWRVYCNTENTWSEGWLETELGKPNYCFNDKNHTINPNSHQDIEVTQVINVKIEQESIPTGGNYKSEGYSFEAAPNTVTKYPVSWKIPITTNTVLVNTDESQIGDTLNAIVGPQTIIGVLTADHPIGTKIFSVNSTVTTNLVVGYEVILGSYNLGICTRIDKANYLIETEFVSSVAYTAGTYLKAQVRIIKNFILGRNGGLNLGTANVKGKYLPANTTTSVEYTNNSNTTKVFSFNIEFLY